MTNFLVAATDRLLGRYRTPPWVLLRVLRWRRFRPVIGNPPWRKP